MRFKELMESSLYTIAVDLDGVLVDFMHTANRISGMRMKEGELDAMEKHVKDQFWATIVDHIEGGNQFFGAMQPMRDAMVLWNYVKRHPHFVLTAAGGRLASAAHEKRTWVKTHLGNKVKVEIVDKAADKAKFATPYTILIDDRPKSIDPFVAAGGIGILHTDAKSTIRQLKKLGL